MTNEELELFLKDKTAKEISECIATIYDEDPYTLLGLINIVLNDNKEIIEKYNPAYIGVLNIIDGETTTSTVDVSQITKDTIFIKAKDQDDNDLYFFRGRYSVDPMNPRFKTYIFIGSNINSIGKIFPTSLFINSRFSTAEHKWLSVGGTDVTVNGQFVDNLAFLTDPQTQLTNLVQLTNELGIEDTRLDALIDALDSTKADKDSVATKQEYFTYKYEGDLNVLDINDFRTKVYEQRKNPVRRWQFEINPNNVDLMSILGYPNGFSTSEKGFLYIHIPYSEAGGFVINLELYKRNGMPVAKRTMASTLNSNWMDTDWYANVTVEEVNNTFMGVPSDTVENDIFQMISFQDIKAKYNGIIGISIKSKETSVNSIAKLQVRSIDKKILKYGNNISITVPNVIYETSIPVSKGDIIRLIFTNLDDVVVLTSQYCHSKEV